MDTSIQEQLQAIIAEQSDAVDYLEIRLEKSESTSISFRGPSLDAVDRSFTLAGGIRACHRGGWRRLQQVLVFYQRGGQIFGGVNAYTFVFRKSHPDAVTVFQPAELLQ